MRGITTIELFNAKTGELEKKAEDHNLVTDALRYVMNIAQNCGANLDSEVFPIATNALGGILLFDGTLTEDIRNVHFPTKDVHLVGYADGSTNTSDIHRGSFNAAESGPVENGYKSVWDFGTSQANGTIKALARTSNYAASNPLINYMGYYSSSSNGSPSTDGSWYPVRYDGEYLYMFKNVKDSIRVSRVRRAMLHHNVYDFASRVEDYEAVTEFDTECCSFTYVSSSSGATNSYTYCCRNEKLYFDGGDGFLYCVYAGFDPEKEPGHVFNWFTIKYSDGSYSKSDIHTMTIAPRVLCNYDTVSVYDKTKNTYVTQYVSYFSDPYQIRVRNGYLYVIAVNQKEVLKVSLKNPVDVKAIRVIEDGSSDYIYSFQQITPYNGGVPLNLYHYTKDGYEWRNGLVYEDGTVFLHNFKGTRRESDWSDHFQVCGDHLECFGYYDSSRIYRGYVANYLGTIANLSSPIEKNASQTMKITYTLLDEDKTKEAGS